MSIVAGGKMVQDVSGVALNVVTGQAWEFSETAITATRDIIVKEGGKVVSHVQVKDTVNCINKTIQKAVESYRITAEQKDYLKSLRVK